MRWPAPRWIRPSFLTSMWTSSPGDSRPSDDHPAGVARPREDRPKRPLPVLVRAQVQQVLWLLARAWIRNSAMGRSVALMPRDQGLNQPRAELQGAVAS